MFEHQKILILGFARSGYEAAKFLAYRNNEIIINDKKCEQDKDKVEELKKLLKIRSYCYIRRASR